MKGPFNPAGRPAVSMIVLSGLDGSGKSTQTALLAERLCRDGVRSRAIWNRWEPFLSAPFIRLAKRYLKAREKFQGGDYRGFTEAKRRRMRSGWKQAVWQWMVWSEYALQVRRRTLFPRLRGALVICDRYVYDTLIDIAINFSIAPHELETLMGHPLLALFPKPALVVFIDIAPEVGAARKSDGTPAAYLADRREYYTALSRIMDAPLVDGGESVESVSSAIWKLTETWREAAAKSTAPPSGEGRRS